MVSEEAHASVTLSQGRRAFGGQGTPPPRGRSVGKRPLCPSGHCGQLTAHFTLKTLKPTTSDDWCLTPRLVSHCSRDCRVFWFPAGGQEPGRRQHRWHGREGVGDRWTEIPAEGAAHSGRGQRKVGAHLFTVLCPGVFAYFTWSWYLACAWFHYLFLFQGSTVAREASDKEKVSARHLSHLTPADMRF